MDTTNVYLPYLSQRGEDEEAEEVELAGGEDQGPVRGKEGGPCRSGPLRGADRRLETGEEGGDHESH